MFDNVKAIFPRKPLKIKYHGILNPIFMFFSFVAFFSVAVFSIYTTSPELLRDMEISKDYVELPDADVGGTCKFGKRGSTQCDVTIVVPEEAKNNSGLNRGSKKHHVELSFWSSGARDYSVTAVASRSNPDLVTIDLALEKLTERIIVFVGTILLFAGLSGYFLYKMLEQIKLRRAFNALNDKILRPVSVEITGSRRAWRKNIITYVSILDGKKQKITTIMGKQEPFYINDAPYDSHALGVTDEKGEIVLLLDEALTRLDLSDAERANLRAARGEAL